MTSAGEQEPEQRRRRGSAARRSRPAVGQRRRRGSCARAARGGSAGGAAEVARRAGGAAVEAACDDALRSASRGCHWLREECSYGRFWEDLRIEVEDSWVSSSSIRVAAQGQQKAGVGDKRFGAAGFFRASFMLPARSPRSAHRRARF